MSRDELHQLIDCIPDDELPAAKRFLQFLALKPAYRTALSAPPDDECVTERDAAAIAQGREEVRGGKSVPHDDILREFGLR